MYDVVVVGGGWSGCSAALAASKQSLKVALLERADCLLGVGLVGGVIKNKARFTVFEEIIAMGGGELFHAMERCIIHRDINLPNHENVCTYDVYQIGHEVDQVMNNSGVDIRFKARVVEAKVLENRVVSVVTTNGNEFSGKVFIDATGSAGPEELCRKHGRGCVQCMLRCPTFGPRTSLTALAGVEEGVGASNNARDGVMSGGSHLVKESLAPEVQRQLSENGFFMVPMEAWEGFAMGLTVPPKYMESKETKDNLIGMDIGMIECLGRPFIPLDKLHSVKGFEHARFCDPLAGGVGNSIRFLALAGTDRNFKVPERENLYVAGEKAGPWVGKTEAVITGLVAGSNAGRQVGGEEPVKLPLTTAVGFGLDYVAGKIAEGEKNSRYSFAGGSVFEAVNSRGLYTADRGIIQERIEKAGFSGFFTTGRHIQGESVS